MLPDQQTWMQMQNYCHRTGSSSTETKPPVFIQRWLAQETGGTSWQQAKQFWCRFLSAFRWPNVLCVLRWEVSRKSGGADVIALDSQKVARKWQELPVTNRCFRCFDFSHCVLHHVQNRDGYGGFVLSRSALFVADNVLNKMDFLKTCFPHKCDLSLLTNYLWWCCSLISQDRNPFW